MELKQCIDEIASGFFSPEDPALFRELASSLLNNDRYAVCDICTVSIRHKLHSIPVRGGACSAP